MTWQMKVLLQLEQGLHALGHVSISNSIKIRLAFSREPKSMHLCLFLSPFPSYRKWIMQWFTTVMSSVMWFISRFNCITVWWDFRISKVIPRPILGGFWEFHVKIWWAEVNSSSFQIVLILQKFGCVCENSYRHAYFGQI